MGRRPAAEQRHCLAWPLARDQHRDGREVGAGALVGNGRITLVFPLAEQKTGLLVKLTSGRNAAPAEKESSLRRQLVAVTALVAIVCCAEAGLIGKASYYNLGGRTASGSHVGSFTAAHRTLPFGSRVRVTNLKNNRSVVVTINDRGPFVGGRLIDVSANAADALGFRSTGVAQVKLELPDGG